MTNSSRGLGGKVVRGLSKVGLVWSLAVLAVMFMAMSAQGQYGDDARAAVARASSQPVSHAGSGSGAEAEGPRAAGVALALLFLGVGGSVLVVGAVRDEREVRRRYALQSDPAAKSPLAFGLSELV
jgi:hypothetical protein